MTVLIHRPRLPRPRRVPRQMCVSATCQTSDCPRVGLDVLPELGACPICQQPLAETRTVTR